MSQSTPSIGRMTPGDISSEVWLCSRSQQNRFLLFSFQLKFQSSWKEGFLHQHHSTYGSFPVCGSTTRRPSSLFTGETRRQELLQGGRGGRGGLVDGEAETETLCERGGGKYTE